LEEQLREMDHRADEHLADEQKRNRDLIARMEREKQLEIENYSIRFFLNLFQYALYIFTLLGWESFVIFGQKPRVKCCLEVLNP